MRLEYLAVLPSWGIQPGRPMTLRPALSHGLPFSERRRTVADTRAARSLEGRLRRLFVKTSRTSLKPNVNNWPDAIDAGIKGSAKPWKAFRSNYRHALGRISS